MEILTCTVLLEGKYNNIQSEIEIYIASVTINIYKSIIKNSHKT